MFFLALCNVTRKHFYCELNPKTMKRLLLLIILLIVSGRANGQTVNDTLASSQTDTTIKVEQELEEDEEWKEPSPLSIKQADSLAPQWGMKKGVIKKVFQDWREPRNYYIEDLPPEPFTIMLRDSLTGSGQIGVYTWEGRLDKELMDTVVGELGMGQVQSSEIIEAMHFYVTKSIGIEFSTIKSIEFAHCGTPNFAIVQSDIDELTFSKVIMPEITLEKYPSDFFRAEVSDALKNLGTLGTVYVRESDIYKIEIDGYRIHQLLIDNRPTSDDSTLHRLDTLVSEGATYDSIVCYHPGSIKRIAFNKDKISAIIHLSSSNIDELLITNCNIGSLNIEQCAIKDSLVLSNTHISKNSRISSILKGQFILQNLAIDEGTELDLRNLYDTLKNGQRRRIPINLFDVKVEQLYLDWRNFRLDYSENDKTETVNGIYQGLMENFKRRGQMESLELLDKDYQSFRNSNIPVIGRLWDKIELFWWNYGYGGWQVIIWTLLLPFIWAFFIPYRKVLRLHSLVYEVDNFEPIISIPHKNQWWKKYMRKLTYVAVIFYALSIKFEKLHYKRGGLIVLFVAIYLNGIFCLFFIANFLLKA